MRSRLKFKPTVLLSALRTNPFRDISTHYVKMVATSAAKGRPATLTFETRVIAMVIIQPEAEKESGHQEAVNDGRDLQPHEQD
jgi:hypothetical protein